MVSYLFIQVLYALGLREAAVKLAVETIDNPYHKQFDRIWKFLGEQTEIPLCQECGFPLLENDPHTGYCQDQTLNLAEKESMLMIDAFDEEADNYSYDDPHDQEDEVDDDPSYVDVYNRALRHFGGNHELAREAASLYPGDFI